VLVTQEQKRSQLEAEPLDCAIVVIL